MGKELLICKLFVNYLSFIITIQEHTIVVVITTINNENAGSVA